MAHIDQHALAAFIQHDDELLGELAIMFVQSLPDSEARLRYAVDHRDASVLRETVHQLKSRLAYFSAESLQQQALHLEQCGRGNQLDEARPLVEQLLIGIEEMLCELRLLTRLPLQYSCDD